MTEESPTVTVIIPTYNSSGTLQLSLETVLWQDFTDFEVWVVGDGCTDDSKTIVSSFGDTRVHWVNLSVNSGTPSMPRNEALRRARGRLVAYLGHDDLWFPWHLSELVDCIEKSNCDLAFSLGVMLGPEGAVGTFTLPKTAWDRKAAISPSNWLHRKNLIVAGSSPSSLATFLTLASAKNLSLRCKRREPPSFSSIVFLLFKGTDSLLGECSWLRGIRQTISASAISTT